MLFPLVITNAQSLQPSEQAKGYLESKNTMVDYATGIFHYNIPLFNLQEGDFKLPVTLSYTGQGFKLGDLAGSIGKNWDLLVGGVITKTVREGIYNQETDIYSLVINGNVIRFVLQNNKAVPLEKTNVKILYNKSADTWVVTDENGIKYDFDAREITKNGCIEEIVSTHNIDHIEYTSSWYPTRISTPSGSSIIFKYSVPYNGKNARLIDSTSYVSGVNNRFLYGRPMTMWPFNFQVYRADFERALDNAYEAAQYQYMKDHVNATISILDIRSGQIYTNPSYDAQMQNLKMQRQVMGIITDMHEVAGISKELFDLINEMIKYYGRNSTPAMYLDEAKRVLDRMARRTIELPAMQRPSYVMYTIMPIYLEKIQFGKQEISFQYDKRTSFASKSRVLKKIVFQDQLRQKTQEIKFTNLNDLLKQITWTGKDNSVIKNYDFSYFNENKSVSGSGSPSRVQLQADYWGFYSNKNSSPQDSVLAYLPDNEYAKTHSLQRIITPEGGEIEIDYELNRYGGPENNNEFGGIRVKHLVLKNNEGNIDSIKYHYPGSACLLYNGFVTHEKVNYPSGLQDLVIKSRAKFQGNAYVNPGNNGLLYEYVIEEFKGKGYNSYLFSVPKSSAHQPENTYPFWLCGLPLANAIYNNDKNLVMLQKMKYSTDMAYCNINVNPSDWFEAGEQAFNYTKRIYQKSVSEYYMDKGRTKSEYEGYEKTLIYNDPYGFGTLYYDPMDSYYVNIEPRTDAYDSEAPYYLRYGGITLPKEQVTYQFSGKVSTAIDKNHLTGNLPSGYYIVNKTGFIYDTLNVSPVGIRSFLSNGDEEVTLWKNALCFQKGVNTVIDEMRDSNFFMPVKQIKLAREVGETNYTLLTEDVINYIDTLLPSSRKTFLPAKVYSYKGGTASYIASKINTLEQAVFSTDLPSYTITSQINYELTSDKYLAKSKKTPEGQDVICYEKERGQVILEVKNMSPDYVKSTDTYRWGLVNRDIVSNVQQLNSLQEETQRYIQILSQFLSVTIDPRHDRFIKSPSFKRVYPYLKMINERKEHYTNIKNMADSVHYISIPDLREGLDTLPDMANLVIPLISLLEKYCEISSDEYDLLQQTLNNEIVQVPDIENLIVKTDAQHQRFEVTLLLNPSGNTFTLNYSILKGSSEYTRTQSIQNLAPGRWQLATFILNTGEIPGATSLKVAVPLTGKGISLAVVVPEYAIYDAVSYNADGSILCKFNQSGEMQVQEYDEANRPARINDNSGNIIKEYKYNYSKKYETF